MFQVPCFYVLYLSVGKIDIKEKFWTDQGIFMIRPEVDEFPQQQEVKIFYIFHPKGLKHKQPPIICKHEFEYPGVHELEKGKDITSRGILTVKATDGTYTAERQISVVEGM